MKYHNLKFIELIINYNRKDEINFWEIEELFINEKANDIKREREYGEKRGILKGMSQEKESIVKNMLKEKMDIKLISKLTNLSINKILSLKNCKKLLKIKKLFCIIRV